MNALSDYCYKVGHRMNSPIDTKYSQLHRILARSVGGCIWGEEREPHYTPDTKKFSHAKLHRQKLPQSVE
jgi:hypothetical protein